MIRPEHKFTFAIVVKSSLTQTCMQSFKVLHYSVCEYFKLKLVVQDLKLPLKSSNGDFKFLHLKNGGSISALTQYGP